MTIDMPNNRAIAGLRRLWQEAFGDNDAFLDKFFSTGFSPRRCRCVTFDGRMAAALYWFDCSLGQHKLAYIYAVATDKAFRGRGLCRTLMEDTHKHLKALGYAGAALVPGSPSLFSLYEKLGYTRFCPMEVLTVTPAADGASVTECSAQAFLRLRREALPEGAVLQEGATAAFLSAFTRFYTSGTSLMCVTQEDDTLYFQEYLGSREALPGIVAALQAHKALVRVPGGNPYAMYLDFGSCLHPAYFGIPLD